MMSHSHLVALLQTPVSPVCSWQRLPSVNFKRTNQFGFRNKNPEQNINKKCISDVSAPYNIRDLLRHINWTLDEERRHRRDLNVYRLLWFVLKRIYSQIDIWILGDREFYDNCVQWQPWTKASVSYSNIMCFSIRFRNIAALTDRTTN